MRMDVGGHEFGDTTYTKVFVGGLAWETRRDTMRKYFEQFGDILEAVVITDKNNGRSKGYGFVTFSEPDAATRACVDPAPVIDGRRANCNLAALGVQRSTPTTPQGGNKKSFRVMKSFPTNVAQLQGAVGIIGAAAAATFPSATASATIPRYAIQQGFPYNVYGYPPYSLQDYSYPTSCYYNVYGGGAGSQYPMYGGGGAANIYPSYFQSMLGQGGAPAAAYGHGQGYGASMQHYPQLFHYSSSIATSSAALTTGGFTPHFNGPISFAPIPPMHKQCVLGIKQA